MKRFLFLGLAMGLGGFFPTLGHAQSAGNSKPVSAMASPTAGEAATNSGAKSDEDDSATMEDIEEKTFIPHWTGQLGLTYSTMPTQQGQGQVTKELSLTGTYNISESGDYCSLEVTSGQQLLEGANTNYGEVTGEGGLGIGVFQPSLSFAFQEGSSALNSETATLNLNFQVMDSLTVGPTGNMGLQSHQGPTTQIYPNNTNDPDSIMVVDTGDWLAGMVVTFVPWDILTLSLTGEQETDYTFDTHGITGKNFKTINQPVRMPSGILEGELTFLKDFQLELSAQAGEEYFEAGTVFNPVTGKTQTFAKATQSSFEGFTVGLLYNFQ